MNLQSMLKRKAKEKKDEFSKMSLVDHLSEFRKRLIIVIVFFLISAVISFNFVQFFVNALIDLAQGYNFVYLAPSELIMQYVKIALICGVSLTSPIILFELWMFVCPGLKKKEKFSVFMAFLCGFAFFCLGAIFAYSIMIPIMLQFFLKIDSTQTIQPMISFANYLSFITSNLITFGIVFEMPVITTLLASLGILKPEWLSKGRGTIIVVIFVVAAFLTPPDIVSQFLIALPMIGLFELSVLLCKILVFRRKRRNEKLGL